jgi:L-lactate dehydrogenase complex protein LldG
MSASAGGRTAILGTIRRGLNRGALPADQAMMLRARLAAHPRQLIPARTAIDHAEQVALFIRMAELQFVTFTRIADEAGLPEAIADYLKSQNLPADLVVAPHPDLQAVDWAASPLLTIRYGRAESADMVSVQRGFAGIAETGTLMLPSGGATPTTLNLLPDTEIVLLKADQIVGAYEEAFDRLRETGDFMPRNVMLVTGPSRSADIERTLELGAHGPRRLHIVLVGEADHAGSQATE